MLGPAGAGRGPAAFLPAGVATAPVLGLSLLSLPLLASLQFYAGYPLRVVTAEASRWLLPPASASQRSGASLLVNGQLVIVDAPCSGVQMLWLGYFTACVVALRAGRDDRVSWRGCRRSACWCLVNRKGRGKLSPSRVPQDL